MQTEKTRRSNGKKPAPSKARKPAPAKAPEKHPVGKPKPEAKPAYPFTRLQVLAGNRKELSAWTKAVYGQEPRYDVPEYALRHLLTLLLNGETMDDARAKTAAMLKSNPPPPAPGKGAAKAPPVPSKAPVKAEVKVEAKAPAKPAPLRDPVKPTVPGEVTSIVDYPVDYLIEAIVARILKPFEYFFLSLTENEKEKRPDAALQKAWDKHHPGYKVSEIRDAFNARLSTLNVPPILAREVPARFRTF